MKILLDTHSFLWFIMGDSHLSIHARTLIEDMNNQRLLSVASVWEMAVKISIGKMSIGTQPFGTFIARQLEINYIGILDIALYHTALVSSLPFHHRDPFDRMIIAQALADQIPIVGRDPAFDDYAVTRLW